jgi:hypothetical protein
MNNRKFLIISSLTFGLLAVAFLLFVLGLMGIKSSVAHAQLNNTHYVAPGEECGEATPCYESLQAAVDAAANGDLIKVSQGRYTSSL